MGYSPWGRKESGTTERLSTAQVSSYKITFFFRKVTNKFLLWLIFEIGFCRGWPILMLILKVLALTLNLDPSKCPDDNFNSLPLHLGGFECEPVAPKLHVLNCISARRISMCKNTCSSLYYPTNVLPHHIDVCCPHVSLCVCELKSWQKHQGKIPCRFWEFIFLGFLLSMMLPFKFYHS